MDSDHTSSEATDWNITYIKPIQFLTQYDDVAGKQRMHSRHTKHVRVSKSVVHTTDLNPVTV